jgi:hypothetical protein
MWRVLEERQWDHRWGRGGKYDGESSVEHLCELSNFHNSSVVNATICILSLQELGQKELLTWGYWNCTITTSEKWVANFFIESSG